MIAFSVSRDQYYYNYYEADGLGSITSLSNPNAEIAQTYTCDSFGNQTSAFGSLTNAFRYTGRELDPEIDLYYYRARYYDAQIGGFVSQDPIGFRGGLNLYRYTGNSPANYRDPFGLRQKPFQFFPPESVVDAMDFWGEFGVGLTDMWSNYRAMRNVNTKGVDKYYHCMAHCESASQGPGGRFASDVVGELREDFDYWKGDPVGDSVQDARGNSCGRNAAPDCKNKCKALAPPWFTP